MKIKIKAYAKINLMLDIVSKRQDGYHDLFMIMQSVGIYDAVILNENKSKAVTIKCSAPGVPCDSSNIAHKAAIRFYKELGEEPAGLEIELIKKIPHAAGLAGGSADGAAVLKGLNFLHNDCFTESELCKIGSKIGADLPFCIRGGTLLAQGIGDVLSKIKRVPACSIVLAMPDFSVNTAHAYAQFDKCGKTHTPNCLDMLCAMQSGDLHEICPRLENVFEQFIEVPGRIEIKEKLRRAGALGVCMSGSGPTIYGIFDNKDKAAAAAESLKTICKDVFLTKPVRLGCKICAVEDE
ncbi:MAG: 4-(cytidine 5'-diphospho)-2-C-methyl-D-erythritol kinase [Clostridiales bacterium]|nr:4-(cytidine 5'-diphospho)-2-C-methyl-D-erythritol kinase [Clostridiales bacterium]